MTNIEFQMIISQEVKRNSFPFYQQLRATEPLIRVTMSNGNYYWMFTRYEDMITMLKDPRIVNDFRKVQSFTKLPAGLKPTPSGEKPHPQEQVNGHLLLKDVPDHTRLRSLVSQAFTPRFIENLRGKVQQIADELLDKIQEKESTDLIADFAFPLSFRVLSDLLGIPLEKREQFQQWIGAIVANDENNGNLEAAIDYLKSLIIQKRAHPMDDLVSRLIQAETIEGKLSEHELVSMLFLLFIAGYDTTVNLISIGTMLLLQHPDQLHKLQANPELIISAVEELLRCTSPTESTLYRWAKEDIEIYGQTIHKGDIVTASIISANQEASQFDDPEMLNIERQPNKHMAFGKGIHFCLGAPLARLEGQIVFSTLFTRFPNLQLALDTNELHWLPNRLFHGVTSLPVTL